MDKEINVMESRGDFSIAKKTELKFHFHNPNTKEETADYILKILIESNKRKLDRILRETAGKREKEEESYIKRTAI